ncbi:carbohydrate-binding module family 18 protein [Piromyces sp. E2]|nr:carbohydrate-binding module family 18 protein [Piromyces sp. E2]|eukprot:OUM68744.1 carbohydrate-binding module family 18 protein [Piromyces sp. E2]
MKLKYILIIYLFKISLIIADKIICSNVKDKIKDGIESCTDKGNGNGKKASKLDLSDNNLKEFPKILTSNCDKLIKITISDNCFDCKSVTSSSKVTCKNNIDYTKKCLPKCGEIDGKKVKCLEGQCCSKDGVCGTTPDFCSIEKECQSEFGECFITCDELLKKIPIQKVDDEDDTYCEDNENGYVNSLSFHNKELTDEQIQYVFNIKTLKNL